MARHRKKFSKCPNCATQLRAHDNFCPHCGQENHELKVPFSHLFLELFESLFHFETKFFATLKIIFTRPGQITRDFWDGKRARYMHPFRLYIFVSVLFFLAANKAAERGAGEIGKSVKEIQQNNRVKIVELNDLIGSGNKANDNSLLTPQALNELTNIDLAVPVDSVTRHDFIVRLKNSSDNNLDSLLNKKEIAASPENRIKLRQALALVPDTTNIPTKLDVGPIKTSFRTLEERELFFRNLKEFSNHELDSVLVTLQVKPSWFNRTLLKQISKVDVNDEHSLQDVTHAFMKNLSLIMFVLMPVVAVFLLWAFFGQKKYYFEHLIFSIHAHTILFILFTLALTIDYFAASTALIITAFILNWLYFFISLKTVYREGWLSTIFKFLILSLVYLILVFAFSFGAFVWGFMTF